MPTTQTKPKLAGILKVCRRFSEAVLPHRLWKTTWKFSYRLTKRIKLSETWTRRCDNSPFDRSKVLLGIWKHKFLKTNMAASLFFLLLELQNSTSKGIRCSILTTICCPSRWKVMFASNSNHKVIMVFWPAFHFWRLSDLRRENSTIKLLWNKKYRFF